MGPDLLGHQIAGAGNAGNGGTAGGFPGTVRAFEEVARQRLDPDYYDYVAAGARDEVTVGANEAGFARLALLPRMLRGNDKRSLETLLLNSWTSMPVLLSPTAFHRLMTPDGERATARAAAAAGTILITAMAATVAVEDVIAASREVAGDAAPDVWFQMYLQPQWEVTEALVDRATRAGAAALVVTIDSPVPGVSDRCERPSRSRGETRSAARPSGRVWSADWS
jgi:4-hydroxymandelate oxidase